MARMRNITNWETGRGIRLYPPWEIPASGSFLYSVESNAAEPIYESPERQRNIPNIEPPNSPSQVPDSQPTTPVKTRPEGSPFLPSKITPKVSRRSIGHADSEEQFPRVYESAIRPPRLASLEPINLSQAPFPSARDTSISSDNLPDLYPLFTSTPKSPPLKKLLSIHVRFYILSLFSGKT
jgi:hypothetical protein